MEAWRQELYHHGIKGMRWGVRRYQNPDGSLTGAGKKRYLNSDGTLTKAGRKQFRKQQYKRLHKGFYGDIDISGRGINNIHDNEGKAVSTDEFNAYLAERSSRGKRKAAAILGTVGALSVASFLAATKR